MTDEQNSDTLVELTNEEKIVKLLESIDWKLWELLKYVKPDA